MFAFTTPFTGTFSRPTLTTRDVSHRPAFTPTMVATRPMIPTTTMDEFWRQADESKLNAQYESDTKIAFLQTASAEEVKKICTQYRYFVHNYPDNLSSLVGKLPYGELKSLLSQILAEELGSGQEKDAHIVWYDRFLRSIGVSDEELATSLYPENGEILDEIANRCANRPFEHVIGLAGMGGECLCQIYLTNMYKYLVENPYIKSIKDTVDWHFWTYHIGEEDILHRQLVRQAINRMVKNPNSVNELAEGYDWGKHIWDEFWTNNYKETRAFEVRQ